MFNYHPGLISITTEQTPRAMIALITVALVYMSIFVEFVPLRILLIWFFFQVLLAVSRYQNAKTLDKFIESNNEEKIKRHVIYFIILNIFQASMWTIASIFSIIYAPSPFEIVVFMMIVGIITAAVLSMSSMFYGFLVFFFCMIIPQTMIMIYYAERQHIALAIFTLIYIPTIILLSKSLYNSQLSAIKNNDALNLSVHKLHILSTIDSLTNIYNRRYFFEMAQNLISIALREQKVVSLLMLDIDFFKDINDEHGHQAGDFILVSLSKEVKSIMRESDIFGRVGGEEFAVLLHNTAHDGAQVIAEKIRKTIENKTFLYNGTPIKLTVSIGISVLDESSKSVEILYKKADKRLYQAKREGRNRVC